MTENWKRTKLGDVCFIRRGSSPRPIKNYLIKDGGMPWVKIGDATEAQGKYIKSTANQIKMEGVPKSVIVNPGDLILSNSGTAGLPMFMGITACIHDGWQTFRDLNGIDKEYLYYYLLYIRRTLLHNAYDSVMKNLTLDMLREYEINLPPMNEQKKIIDILQTIDSKIETNSYINRNLYSQMTLIFMNSIDETWKENELDSVLEFYDYMRKPLSSKQRENMDKNYPYYGATTIVDYVDNYLFEGTYILISEDGANVVDINGIPLTQYTYDKFWVNNHAHIVKGKNGFSEALVLAMMGCTNLQSIVTGAAQPKVNQRNLKGFKRLIPPIERIVEMNDQLEPMLNRMILIDKENETLRSFRDALLPKLMSGELDVSNLDI